MATDAATLLVLVEAAEARAAAAEAALIAVQPAPSPLLAAPVNAGARRAAARADSAPAGAVEGGGGGGDDAEDASLLSVPSVERLRDESASALLPPAPTKWALFAFFLLLLLAAPLGGDGVGGGGALAAPRVEDDPAYAGFFTEAGADPAHCLGAGGWPAAPAAPGVGRLFVANPVPPGYGIGNQVFMLAAVVAYALEFNRCVVLPATDLHPSSSRAHGYDATVFRHFWIQRQLVDNKTAYAAVFEDEAAHVVQPGLSMHYAPFPRPAPRPSPPPPGSGGASDPAPSLAPPPRPPPWMAVLRGGFQHFSYTWAHRDTMRAYFRPHPAVARELLAKYPGLRRGVALHFRRGDYTNGGLPPAALRDFPIPSDFFYMHSVHLATRDEAGAPRVDPPREYFVFTNDYGWARNQTWVKRLPGKITFVEDEDEVYSWYMMMLAGEAVVCANSTFCWWAAYLGAAKRVYLPAHWYNSPGNEPTGIHWPGATVVQSDNEEGEGPPPWYPTPWNSRRAIEGAGHPLFD